MCGRFARKYTTAELAEAFGVDEVEDELQPSFNIAVAALKDLAEHAMPLAAEDRERFLALGAEVSDG